MRSSGEVAGARSEVAGARSEAAVSRPEAAVSRPEAAVRPEAPGSARRLATRTRILDAAEIVFAERGVFGATIEDICEQAGFTRGAVYSNFADKDDILRAVIEREHQELFDHLTGSLAGLEAEVGAAASLEDGLATLIHNVLRTIPIDRRVQLIQDELTLHAIRRPDLAATWATLQAAFCARLAVAFADALRSIGREPTIDPDDFLDAVLAIGERSVRRALAQGAETDAYGLADTILPGFLLAFTRPIDAAEG